MAAGGKVAGESRGFWGDAGIRGFGNCVCGARALRIVEMARGAGGNFFDFICGDTDFGDDAVADCGAALCDRVFSGGFGVWGFGVGESAEAGGGGAGAGGVGHGGEGSERVGIAEIRRLRHGAISPMCANFNLGASQRLAGKALRAEGATRRRLLMSWLKPRPTKILVGAAGGCRACRARESFANFPGASAPS